MVTMEIATMEGWGGGPASATKASEAKHAGCVICNTTGLTAQRATVLAMGVVMMEWRGMGAVPVRKAGQETNVR